MHCNWSGLAFGSETSTVNRGRMEERDFMQRELLLVTSIYSKSPELSGQCPRCLHDKRSHRALSPLRMLNTHLRYCSFLINTYGHSLVRIDIKTQFLHCIHAKQSC